jgi:hypothetical protein
MRIIAATLAGALLSGCASIPVDDPSEWQALSAEAIDGVAPGDIRIEAVHGFMLNTHWTAVTPEARFGCMRDLTGAPTCRKRN